MRRKELRVPQGFLPGRFKPPGHGRKPITEAHVQKNGTIIKMTLAIELMNDIRVLNTVLQIGNQRQACSRRHVRERVSGNLLVNGLADVWNVPKGHEGRQKINLERTDGQRAAKTQQDRSG